jgi:hypothetical protein
VKGLKIMSVYSKATVGNVKVEIIHDTDGLSSPRDWDNLGTILYAHSRYKVGDKTFDTSKYSGWEEALKGEVGNLNDLVYLPVFLYDHSIQHVSTESFIGRALHAEWDSGQVGWVYVTKEQLRKEYGVSRITKDIREKAIKVLKSEIEVFDKYVSGEVYGVKVIELDEDGKEKSSEDCWGFYGSDLENSGMMDYIHEHIEDESVYNQIIKELA